MLSKYCNISVLGFIGKIKLQVPIRRLKSEQWIITLDKLVLVAGPLSDTEVVLLMLYGRYILYICIIYHEIILKVICVGYVFFG